VTTAGENGARIFSSEDKSQSLGFAVLRRTTWWKFVHSKWLSFRFSWHACDACAVHCVAGV